MGSPYFYDPIGTALIFMAFLLIFIGMAALVLYVRKLALAAADMATVTRDAVNLSYDIAYGVEDDRDYSDPELDDEERDGLDEEDEEDEEDEDPLAHRVLPFPVLTAEGDGASEA